MPLAYVMGVTWDDSFKVAELLGVKTFLNEFVAYERLGEMVKNRAAGTANFPIHTPSINQPNLHVNMYFVGVFPNKWLDIYQGYYLYLHLMQITGICWTLPVFARKKCFS